MKAEGPYSSHTPETPQGARQTPCLPGVGEGSVGALRQRVRSPELPHRQEAEQALHIRLRPAEELRMQGKGK